MYQATTECTANQIGEEVPFGDEEATNAKKTRSRRGAISKTQVANAVYRMHAPVADRYKKKFNILCLDGGGMRGMCEFSLVAKVVQLTRSKVWRCVQCWKLLKK